MMLEEELAKGVSEVEKREKTTAQTKTIENSNDETPAKIRYFAFCETSKTRTPVEGPNVLKFFCKDCKKEHTIDDFMYRIEEEFPEDNTGESNQTMPTERRVVSKERVVLEETVSHEKIVITKPGGIIGRYGDFGADYFQSRGMRTISGEHCSIKFFDDEWVLEHLSKTNDTEYDQMKLDHNEEVVLSNDKILTLSKKISFYVRFE